MRPLPARCHHHLIAGLHHLQYRPSNLGNTVCPSP
jgi:hypothetical protein